MNGSRIQRSLTTVRVTLCLLACVRALAAAGADDETAFQAARALEQEGHAKEAFLRYLAISGGEHAAAALARGAGKEYLALLRDTPGSLDTPRVRLVEADLLLASGQRDEAKKLYQILAATAARTNWGSSRAGYYPAEPQQSYGDDQNFQGFARAWLGTPFSYGPGSHRDNWLLRRLLALDLSAEAGEEFARMWKSTGRTLNRILKSASATTTMPGLQARRNNLSGPPDSQLRTAVRIGLCILPEARGATNERWRS